MTASRLTSETRASKQYSSRAGTIPTVLQLHHGATTNSDWMVSVMVSGDKQVSANYVCRADGRLVSVVDEIYRAWTSASGVWDRKSITVETANLSTNGWTISDASHEALAQLAADCSIRYGWGKLNRSGPFSTWNVIGHREINQYTGDSYGTACPGGMDLDRIVRRANEILAGPTTPVVEQLIQRIEEHGMQVFLWKNGKDQGLFETDGLNDALEIHEGYANDSAVLKLHGLDGKDAKIPVLNGTEKSMIDNRSRIRSDRLAEKIAAKVKAL